MIRGYYLDISESVCQQFDDFGLMRKNRIGAIHREIENKQGGSGLLGIQIPIFHRIERVALSVIRFGLK